MSETPQPKTTPEKSLDETQAIAGPTTPAAADSQPTDVTTDFDRSGNPSGASIAVPAMRTANSQQSIADYRLEQKLGEGGMGRVYRAVDSQGRAVAIKLLSQHLTRSDEALQRFKQEGYIASQINHPHCVFVHQVDEDRGTPFIAMELMTGKTLKDLVSSGGPLPYKEALRLIVQCMDGLIEAHRRGMIHRDIKPANCYLDEHGNVKIGDFGLARSLVDDSELTRTGAFLGTPLFASPEQLLGQKIDERSDIYSLSATLYYLLAGQAPFESPNAAQVIAKIASSDPPPLKSIGIKVPAVLEAVLMQGLARDRDKRFESFKKMRAALQPIVEAEYEIASLPRRAVAAFLDWTIFGVLLRIATFAGTSLTGFGLDVIQSWFMVVGVSGWFLYLWLSEWLLGWTIGKRIVKLKVVEKHTGIRQGPSKYLRRTAVFVAATETIRVVSYGLYADAEGPSPGIVFLSYLLGCLAMLLMWKRTGRTQLTHEWLSDTETCLSVPMRSPASAQLPMPAWTLPLVDSAQYPKLMGRFVIRGQIRTGNDQQWYLAHDVKLEREVWIHWLPAGSPPLSASRKQNNSTVRMRVIESGIEQDRHWDAFLAPEGVPLSVFVQQGGQLPWPIAHQLISGLSTCETAAQGELPDDPWGDGKHWINGVGRLTFAETQVELEVGQMASDPKAGTPDWLMHRLAVAALPCKHRLRRKWTLNNATSSTLCELEELPSYTGLRFLERLAAQRLNQPQIKSTLGRLRQTAEQVTPAMRFGHAATITLLVSPLLAMILVVSVAIVVLEIENRVRHCHYLAAIEKIQEHPDAFAEALNPLSPEARARWLSTEKKKQVRELLSSKQSELKIVLANATSLERLVFQSAGVSESNLDRDFTPAGILEWKRLSEEQKSAAAQTESGSQSSSGSESRGGNRKQIEVIAGAIMPRAYLLNGFLNGVEAEPDVWQPVSRNADMKTSIWNAFGMFFGALIAWTGLTRGGLSQMLTGVTIVRRDGRRMGMLRAALRGAVLFSPFVVIPLLYITLEEDLHWWWFTQQMKVALCFLPLLYLVGTVVWPQVAPHDRLFNTVAVPR